MPCGGQGHVPHNKVEHYVERNLMLSKEEALKEKIQVKVWALRQCHVVLEPFSLFYLIIAV